MRSTYEHEQVCCPRCQAGFECKVGSILLCQCITVTLNDDERHYIRKRYDDCLCAGCMRELKQEYYRQSAWEKPGRISTLVRDK